MTGQAGGRARLVRQLLHKRTLLIGLPNITYRAPVESVDRLIVHKAWLVRIPESVFQSTTTKANGRHQIFQHWLLVSS